MEFLAHTIARRHSPATRARATNVQSYDVSNSTCPRSSHERRERRRATLLSARSVWSPVDPQRIDARTECNAMAENSNKTGRGEASHAAYRTVYPTTRKEKCMKRTNGNWKTPTTRERAGSGGERRSMRSSMMHGYGSSLASLLVHLNTFVLN